MNILSIGSDEKVFESGSAIRIRQEAYARELGHADLVVLSKLPHAPENEQQLSLFCSSAASPFIRLLRAYQKAKTLPKPDLVTVQDPFEIGFVGALVARHFKVPLHVQVHTDFLAPEFAQHSLLNRIRVVIAKGILKRASRVRVVSASSKAKLARVPLDVPITVLPIFVDIQKFKNATTPAELASRFERFATKLLVVARLEPEKNVELAMRAFAKSAQINSCLIIVGEGRERERLQALARTLKVSDYVIFEGAQDPAPYYALANLVLVPSKYEGYGLVIVEALAAGKPVLSMDVGIAREAGASISNEKEFAADLKQWFVNGPRSAHIEQYPYRTFEEYLRAYCDDLRSCTTEKISL